MGSLTKLSASPNSLKYAYVSVGGADTAKVLRAALIADCVGGPLKRLLEANGGAALVATQNTPTVSIYVQQKSAINGQASFNADAPDPDGRLLCEAAAAGNATIEIRFNHTLIR